MIIPVIAFHIHWKYYVWWKRISWKSVKFRIYMYIYSLSIENRQDSVNTWIWISYHWFIKFIPIQLSTLHWHQCSSNSTNAKNMTNVSKHFGILFDWKLKKKNIQINITKPAFQLEWQFIRTFDIFNVIDTVSFYINQYIWTNSSLINYTIRSFRRDCNSLWSQFTQF